MEEMDMPMTPAVEEEAGEMMPEAEMPTEEDAE